MRKRSKDPVFRITGARQGLDEDVRGRQRRYVISMSIRTVSVVLAVALWNVARPIAAVALVLGFVLPYVAVVVANAGRENAPSLPSTFLSVPPRLALGAAPAGGTAGRKQDETPTPPPPRPEHPFQDHAGKADVTPDPTGSAPQDLV